MSEHTPEAILTIEEASNLVKDDIAWWMSNPFMDRDALTQKVCWWVTSASRTEHTPEAQALEGES